MIPFERSLKLKSSDAARAQNLTALGVYSHARGIRLRQIEAGILQSGVKVYWTQNRRNAKTRWLEADTADTALLAVLRPESDAAQGIRRFIQVVKGRKIDPAASTIGHDPSSVLPPDSPHAARARLTNAKAEAEEVKLSKMRGELVDRRRAESTIRALSIALRQSWEAWPTRAGPDLAARFGVPLGDMIEALDGAVRQHLAALSGAEKDLDLSRPKTFFDLYHDDQEDLPTAAPDTPARRP